jgi:hypothetical protein
MFFNPMKRWLEMMFRIGASDPKAGIYVIDITQGTLVTPANYTLTFRKGTLRVH